MRLPGHALPIELCLCAPPWGVVTHTTTEGPSLVPFDFMEER